MKVRLRDLLKLEERLRIYEAQLKQAKAAGSSVAALIQAQVDDCESELKQRREALDDVEKEAYEEIVAEREAAKTGRRRRSRLLRLSRRRGLP
jgi:hypothetical protein